MNTQNLTLLGGVVPRPDSFDFNAEGYEYSECNSVSPIPLDKIYDVAKELGLIFNDYGHLCELGDPEHEDYVKTLPYVLEISGEKQWVVDWFEIYEGNYGFAVWKIARALKIKIVQDHWIDYHCQSFGHPSQTWISLANNNPGQFKQALELVWDTHYGDFEYKREFKDLAHHSRRTLA